MMNSAFVRRFRDLYRYAAENSHDPHTQNAAMILLPRRFSCHGGKCGPRLVRIYGANRFPDGLVVTDERSVNPGKAECIVHAEEQAIFAAARKGHRVDGATMFALWAPCHRCARAIVQAGIDRVIVHKAMHNRAPERWKASTDAGIAMLAECDVKYLQAVGKIGGCSSRFDGKVWSP